MSQISEEYKFDFPLFNQEQQISENSKKHFKFHTETLPSELRKLDNAIKAFSKVKLNERGLPF